MGGVLGLKRCALMLAAAASVAGPALATPASPTVDPIRQGEALQRQQQEQLKQDFQTPDRPPTQIEVPVAPPPTVSGDIQCHPIADIEIRSADHLSGKWRAALVSPLQHRCIGVAEVQGLLSGLTSYYVAHGWVTARAYLPRQNLGGGTLVVQVVEGRVQRLTLKGAARRLVLATAFPGVVGRAFNLRTFEQGLDQINRLASNHATLDILAGDQPGDSVILIKNAPQKRWHVTASEDDYGQSATGREQASVTGSYDNLLGLNDFISYTRRQSVLDVNKDRNASSNSATLSVPYGRFLMTAGWNDSNYASSADTAHGNVLALTGTSSETYLKADAMAWRDQRSRLSFSAEVAQQASNNFVDDVKLGVSSRTLSVLTLGAQLNTLVAGGTFSGEVSYGQGLTILGALRDTPSGAPDSPRAQFSKLNIDANYTRPFRIGKLPLIWSSQFSGQLAFDPLYSSQQFSVGSPYNVRGFYRGYLINDHGAYLRNDLSTQRQIGTFRGLTLVASPYVGLDAGYVAGFNRAAPRGTLVGASVGLRLSAGPLNFDVYASEPLAVAGLKNEGVTSFFRSSLSF